VEDEIKVVCGSPTCRHTVIVPAHLTAGQKRTTLARQGWTREYVPISDIYIDICGRCSQ
jgi:hypothetical protein